MHESNLAISLLDIDSIDVVLCTLSEATGKENFKFNLFVYLFNHKNKNCFIDPTTLVCQFVTGRHMKLLPPILFWKVALSLWFGPLSRQFRPRWSQHP